MVKAKVGGIVLGGLAGYLILSKGLNFLQSGIKNICTANQWKNYYKYGKEGNMVPPGYSMHTSTDDGVNTDVGNGQNKPNQPKDNTAVKAAGEALGDALVKTISTLFKGPEAAEGALEGQETACTAVNCPHDCDNCSAQKCPYEKMKFDGKITSWEDGKPVAGRYSWGDDEELCWAVMRKNPDDHEIENNELEEPFYADDLVEGVKVVDPEGDTDGDEILVNGKDPGDPDGVMQELQEKTQEANSPIDKRKE